MYVDWTAYAYALNERSFGKVVFKFAAFRRPLALEGIAYALNERSLEEPVLKFGAFRRPLALEGIAYALNERPLTADK